MKRTNLFKIMSLGAAALLVACSGSEKPVSPKEANLQSASDSASYYLGFMAAGNILQQKQMGDTLLESPERVDAYWDGYQRGMEILRRGDSPEDRAFNAGLLAGAKFAGDIQAQEQTTPEFKFNKQLFVQGYNYSYTPDSVRGLMEASRNLNNTLGAIAERQNSKDAKSLDKNMSDYAKLNGFAKNAAGQYVKILKVGSGPALAVNDSLIISITPRLPKGRDISQFSQQPTGVVLGKTLPLSLPFAQAIVGVKSGSVVELLVKPDDVTRGWAQQLGIGAGQFVILTINADKAE